MESPAAGFRLALTRSRMLSQSRSDHEVRGYEWKYKRLLLPLFSHYYPDHPTPMHREERCAGVQVWCSTGHQ